MKSEKINLNEIISCSELSGLRKVQNVLAKISTNQPVFFNVVLLRDKLKLIKEFGLTDKNCAKWILTEKGKRLLSFQM